MLSATYALDEGPDIAQSATTRVLLGRKRLPGWTIRLLALALLLPPLLISVDALARLRRRREPILRWLAVDAHGARSRFCVRSVRDPARSARDSRGSRRSAASRLSLRGWIGRRALLLATGAVLLLALSPGGCLLRRLLCRCGLPADGAGLAVMLVLLVIALLAWILNPFACLLLVPALHLWLLAVGPARHAWPARPCARLWGDRARRPCRFCCCFSSMHASSALDLVGCRERLVRACRWPGWPTRGAAVERRARLSARGSLARPRAATPRARQAPRNGRRSLPAAQRPTLGLGRWADGVRAATLRSHDPATQ